MIDRTVSINMPAIDVHAHVGRYRDSDYQLNNHFMSGTAAEIVEYARRARTDLTIVSPLPALLPLRHADPIAGNAYGARAVARDKALRLWAVVDPFRPRTFTQAREMLKSLRAVGIKIHPEGHGYPIAKEGRRLFEFAEEQGVVIQSHSGGRQSMPEDFVRLADSHPRVKVILSHLGYGWDGKLTHQVEAIRKSRHGNLFTDTSSAKSITPRLLEWAVKEIGSEHILYGTDSPLYSAPVQRARVDSADISSHDKENILRNNAIRLLGGRLGC